MRLVPALFLLAVMPLGGCAWLLGHGEPPQPEAPFFVEAAVAEAGAGGLAVSATFEGVGKRLVSERNWAGRAGTVVNPYGADSLVFSLTLANEGPEALVLLPQAATLALGDRPPLPARTLDDYRARWPLWAVRDTRDRDHRQAAYAHLLETLLIERRLRPGDRVVGAIAF
ncbi:MAG: hypothetical protein ACLGIN_12370, partial [Candidatus Sericytochromatia bacterium]